MGQHSKNVQTHFGESTYLTLWRLQFFYKLRRLSTHTRSSSISSLRSTLSTIQTGTTIFRRASGSCPTFPLHRYFLSSIQVPFENCTFGWYDRFGTNPILCSQFQIEKHKTSHKHFGLLFWKSGPISASVHLPKTGYVPGKSKACS